MTMDDFPYETVQLVKAQSTLSIQALFDSNLIFVGDVKIPIEEGDFVERILPSKTVEKYLITKVDCFTDSSLSHYELGFEKQVGLKKKENSSIVYNIGNVSGKVNIGSTDNSINCNICCNEKKVFDDLRAVIQESILNNDIALLELDKLENSYGTKTFAAQYHSFIQSVADHITIIAPFLPTLSAMMA